MIRVCHLHGTLKPRGYCRVCRAAKERLRYHSDPERERKRKRQYYSQHMRITMPKKTCTHDDAMIVEDEQLHADHLARSGEVFFCPDCGEFIDTEGATTDDPTEAKAGDSHAGKAFAPSGGVGKQRPTYHRAKQVMETVPCSWPKCKEKMQLYPQNIREKNWCPKIHRGLVRSEQSRLRQIQFRQRHGTGRLAQQ